MSTLSFKTLVPLCLGVMFAAISMSAQAADKPFLADRHVAKGVPCTACHGKNMKEPEEPTIETCQSCHNIKQLVEKTKNVKPTNPHVSPHYQDQLECTNCHQGHDAPVNFCSQCHSFDFKVK